MQQGTNGGSDLSNVYLQDGGQSNKNLGLKPQFFTRIVGWEHSRECHRRVAVKKEILPTSRQYPAPTWRLEGPQSF